VKTIEPKIDEMQVSHFVCCDEKMIAYSRHRSPHNQIWGHLADSVILPRVDSN